MGVNGLMKFLTKDDPQFFEAVPIQNKVVIDGYNIMHRISSCRTNSRVCGGEYQEIGRQLRAFFEMLLSYEIEPIVIFDGGKEDDKMETTFKRRRNCQETVKRALSAKGMTNGKEKLTGPLFRSILEELKIKMIMTEFEADLSMAKFAVEHDCPILSNDSEFAVFSKVKWIKVRVILFSIKYKIEIS